MTYSTGGLKIKKALSMTSLNWSGTASTNTYMTFTINDELPSAFITSLTNSATEINLPAGHYFAQAYADYSRSSVNDNCQFSWYLNGSQEGHYGAVDFYNSKSSDVAETSFTLTSAGVLRLRITAQSGSNVTLNNSHCIALIWRVTS
jgi:hypothetical protein